jgi:heme-degrading monooxygenase HmoA
MVRHVVMWKLKEHAEGADRADNAAKMKAMLDSCASIVPGIRRWQVVLAQPQLEATCDVVLVSDFEDRAALDAYQNHPRHLAMKPFIAAVREQRHCMDYEF